MNVCESSFQAVVIKSKAFVVEPHEVKNRRVEVVNRCWVVFCLESKGATDLDCIAQTQTRSFH